jgi:CBS domain containing-hemolysin-like protein
MTNSPMIALAFFLVLINGFFVAAEFSIVKLRGTRLSVIKKTYGLRGRILERVHNNMDNYLSACQLGITLASIGLGWIGEPAMASVVRPIFRFFQILSETQLRIFSFTLAYGIISFTHIVIGELVPKSIAIRMPEPIALRIALPLYLFDKLMFPVIWCLNLAANAILKLFGIKMGVKTEGDYSSDELRIILDSGHLDEALEEEEIDILKHVLEFSELTVGDMLKPTDEMIALSIKDPMSENIEKITKYRYTRYPLYEEDPDEIVGVLHIKDLLVSLQGVKLEDIDLKQMIRPVIVANQDQTASSLLQEFRTGTVHLAIVKNQLGKVIGFVTLDDLLITLLGGSIGDEFIRDKPDWFVTKQGALLMKGNAPIYALERAFGIEISTPANTLSGLILSHLERMPLPKEKIEFPQFDIIVRRIKGPKILLLEIYRKNSN